LATWQFCVFGTYLRLSARHELVLSVKLRPRTNWLCSIDERRHQRTLELVFARPVSANVRSADIETLFRELGAEIAER
jgi:hypothetical protein